MAMATDTQRAGRALLALALLALLVPLRARAQATGPGCFNKAIELIDNAVAPPEGGDQAFFTKVGGGPPLGLMIFANTPSMFGMSGFEPSQIPLAERGCAKSSYLNSRIWKASSPLYTYSTTTAAATSCTTTVATTPTQDGHGYDPTFVYPRIDDGCYLGSSYKTLDDFVPNGFYQYRSWGDNGSTSKTVSNACSSLPATEQGPCNTCLNAGNPYYISTLVNSTTPNDAIFRGNFLHFFGPSHINALAAWKSTIAGQAKIIWGHGYYDNNLPGIAKGRDPNPACNQFDTGFNTSNRGSYINSFSNTPPSFGGISKFPLAEALFSIGFFLTDVGRFSSASTYVRTSPWTPNTGNNQDTICTPCQFSAAVVITDGQVSNDTAIHPTIQAMNVATPGDKSALGLLCTKPSDCGTSLQCVNGTCQDQWWADDVAAYFARNDVRHTQCGISTTNPSPTLSCDPEPQYMTTYVVNVGAPNNPALQNVAAVSGGLYLEASSASQLKDDMNKIVNDIIRRSTSYSVASVTSVQTRSTTAAFVPRFKPSVLTNWEGHLYRYNIFSEVAAGCTSADTAGPFTADKLSRNPNGDSTCNDVYIVDADGSYVGENSNGDYMKLDTTQAYPWPATSNPAKPIWDGADRLVRNGPAARNVYVAYDVNQDGVLQQGEQISFDASNVNQLVGLLGLGGATGSFCTQMGTRLGYTFGTESDCAAILIRWVRGEDVFDENGNGNTSEARPVVLGDIFHSTPTLVVPPLREYLCELGANVQQCSASLFRTPTPNGDSAYTAFQQANQGRTQFVVVGANDGMIHAFEAGTQRTGDDPTTPIVEPSTNTYFDSGTGRELWAFIPPEFLPKLKRMLTSEGHKEYVDGSPMVRDIWVDLNKDGQKSQDEFKTVLINGMRRGGRSYVALDVTNPSSPSFLWSNPPAGSADALLAGQAWGDFAPRPPPIVPVMAKAVSPYVSTFTVNGTPTREEWVVFVGGGFDPAGVRGRSIHAIDAWTGQRVFRYAFRDNTGTSDPRYQLGPVAAAVATVDWGNQATNDFGPDYFFDTANVGDLFGNIWTLRFGLPGEDTDGDGLYDNWFGGRAFDTNKNQALGQALPFFEMPAHAVLLDTKTLRLYQGTGDRSQIRDQQGGVCSLANLPACMRKGCSVDVNMSAQSIGAAASSARWTASPTATVPTTNSVTGIGGTPSCTSNATSASFATAINCGTAGSGTYTYGVDCPAGDLPCNSTTQRPLNTIFPFDGTTRLNTFYSVRVFDGTRAPFASASAATNYDSLRLTDSDLATPDAASPTFATSSSNGFLVRYGAQNERTSGAAFVPGGNILYWSTLTPLTTFSSCSRTGSDTGSLYRANAVTGGTSFDTGTNVDVNGAAVSRYTSQTVLTPPKTLISQKVLTPGGEVVTVGLAIEPGQQPVAIQTGRSDLYAPIEMLEVDRAMHDCRHASTPNCRQ